MPISSRGTKQFRNRTSERGPQAAGDLWGDALPGKTSQLREPSHHNRGLPPDCSSCVIPRGANRLQVSVKMSAIAVNSVICRMHTMRLAPFNCNS